MRCPRCRTEATVQAGRYDAIDGGTQFEPALQVLHDIRVERQEAQRLLAIFDEALRNPRLDAKSVRQTIEKTPELRGLADAIPTSRAELYAFVQAVIMVLTALAGAGLGIKKLVTPALRRRRKRKQREAVAAAEERQRQEAERECERRVHRERVAKRLRDEARRAKATVNPRKEWKEKKPERSSR